MRGSAPVGAGPRIWSGPTRLGRVLRSDAQTRLLGSGDLTEFLGLASTDPVVNVFADHRARTTMLDPRWLGGEVWGRFVDGALVAACHAGANLVPIACTPEDARLFAERALPRRRSTATVVGPAAAARAMWEVLEPRWAPAREIRLDQPHLEIAGPPAVAPDPLVRRSEPGDLAHLYPACVAMYTEEVGVSPEAGGAADHYLARVRELVGRGWSFARYDTDGSVLFKAEVSSASPFAAQVQGVWVRPDRRGEGLAPAGMAAVVELVRAQLAPVVSLYVNSFNTPARAAYQRVGFRQTSTFSTVML